MRYFFTRTRLRLECQKTSNVIDVDLSDDCESLDSALEPVAPSTAGAASITQPAGRMVLGDLLFIA